MFFSEDIHGNGISTGLSESLSDLASTPVSDGSKDLVLELTTKVQSLKEFEAGGRLLTESTLEAAIQSKIRLPSESTIENKRAHYHLSDKISAYMKWGVSIFRVLYSIFGCSDVMVIYIGSFSTVLGTGFDELYILK
ncbi:uncharacterized protein [Henckelia pumila]|uniref:uncharacterized protein n=1 Tax=Henckelia pumila TaxID=405737 RepID=UPI003C6E92AC